MKKIILVLMLAAAGALWWLLLDSRAPAKADGEFDIAAWRALIADDAELPTAVDVEIISRDYAPYYAAETGGGFGEFALYNTGFKIASPSMTTIIGGAMDRATFEGFAQSKKAEFYDSAYQALENSYLTADQILITHEHIDHVMAITRNAHPVAFADRLKLNADQIAALPQFGPEGGLSPVLKNLTPADFSKPTRIAPGLVVAPAPGHTPGSQVFYWKRADGREYLLVGDIVWAVSNIVTLKTRPRLLQFIFFKPHEDRARILRQVRALHDLVKANPELIVISEHDGANIDRLIEEGLLTKGFAQHLEK